MATMRTCCVCGNQKLWDGFVYGDGLRYYCSEECLHEHFTHEEWTALYEESEADGSYDCYWTEWYDSVFYEVTAVSRNGVIKLIDTFDDHDEAKTFCREHNWVLQHPEDGSLWRLKIRKETLDHA